MLFLIHGKEKKNEDQDKRKIPGADWNSCWDGLSFYQGEHVQGDPMLFDVDLKVQASYQG
jgi:hypothetical protein